MSDCLQRLGRFLNRLASVIFILFALQVSRAQPADLTEQADHFPISEAPKNLRTDLKGASIRIALPENAPDAGWNDALIEKFRELTGIDVQIVRPGSDTTAVLATYLENFRRGTPLADVYAIDIVWPGILAPYAEGLSTQFRSLPGVLPALVKNDTVEGKLVAIPYFTEISLLYYRQDLLRKYHYDHPPRTWNELDKQARTIMNGERAGGNPEFWGYLWQGAASEALTCNALEWEASQGAGPVFSDQGTLQFDPAIASQAWSRAGHWIGTISPPETTRDLEDDSLRRWMQGQAAFMRNWPYAYSESNRNISKVRGRFDVSIMPAGDGPGGHPADMLGGFQLMIDRSSKQKDSAIELVRFLTSPEIQRVNARVRGYAPTRSDLFLDSAVLRANPLFRYLHEMLAQSAITRPSTAAADRYDAMSSAYFSAVRHVLTGQQDAADAAQEFAVAVARLMAH